jgi:Glycosyl hydrolases family 31 TIM-barrel domain
MVVVLPEGRTEKGLYWEGSQLWRPNERPYALHRNGAAGMARYAAFLWSGDVQNRWETLKNHVPSGINTGLSGIPYWVLISVDSSRPRNTPVKCSSGGSNMAPSVHYSDRTAETGISTCLGAGTLVIPVRRKPPITPRIRRNYGIRRLNRSVRSISSSGIECCPKSIQPCAKRTKPDFR